MTFFKKCLDSYFALYLSLFIFYREESFNLLNVTSDCNSFLRRKEETSDSLVWKTGDCIMRSPDCRSAKLRESPLYKPSPRYIVNDYVVEQCELIRQLALSPVNGHVWNGGHVAWISMDLDHTFLPQILPRERLGDANWRVVGGVIHLPSRSRLINRLINPH